MMPQGRTRGISIHAPRTGSDAAKSSRRAASRQFQSTLPARGATRTVTHKRRRERFQSTLPARGATVETQNVVDVTFISIHAPRTGSDTSPISSGKSTTYFNPRSPHGERPAPASPGKPNRYFNPRSPHGERRAGSGGASGTEAISIHAPRTGSDGN